MNSNLPPGVTDRDIDRHFGGAPDDYTVIQDEIDESKKKVRTILDDLIVYIDEQGALTPAEAKSIDETRQDLEGILDDISYKLEPPEPDDHYADIEPPDHIDY